LDGELKKIKKKIKNKKSVYDDYFVVFNLMMLAIIEGGDISKTCVNCAFGMFAEIHCAGVLTTI
jgi:hypothetical protein